jgi:hypothetical protein
MQRWTHLRTVLPLAVVLATSAIGAQESRSSTAGLDEYIESVRLSWGIPGLAVGIVKDDSLVCARGFGVREVGKPDRVDESTVFAIGSNILDGLVPQAEHMNGPTIAQTNASPLGLICSSSSALENRLLSRTAPAESAPSNHPQGRLDTIRCRLDPRPHR